MSKQEVLDNLRSQIANLQSAEPASAGFLKETEPAAYVGFAKEHGSTSGSTAQPLVFSEEQDGAAKVLSKIVALVNASEKSERTIRERLARCDFSQQDIDEGVSRALSYGIIDDERYARTLIRSRINQGLGCIGIERELRKNDIDPDCLQGWPYEFGIDPNDEFDRALELLRRKPPHAKNLRDSAYRKLMQKGYSSSVASSAARIWSENLVTNA